MNREFKKEQLERRESKEGAPSNSEDPLVLMREEDARIVVANVLMQSQEVGVMEKDGFETEFAIELEKSFQHLQQKRELFY